MNVVCARILLIASVLPEIPSGPSGTYRGTEMIGGLVVGIMSLGFLVYLLALYFKEHHSLHLEQEINWESAQSPIRTPTSFPRSSCEPSRRTAEDQVGTPQGIGPCGMKPILSFRQAPPSQGLPRRSGLDRWDTPLYHTLTSPVPRPLSGRPE